MLDVVVIVPPIRNTTILGPLASTAALKLPTPESLRVVTSMTLPPRPPTLLAPKPSAPGNAGRKLVDARDEPQRCPNEVKRITIQLKMAVYRQLEANNCLKVKTLRLIRAKQEDDDLA